MISFFYLREIAVISYILLSVLYIWPWSFLNEDVMLSSSGHYVFSLLKMSVHTGLLQSREK